MNNIEILVNDNCSKNNTSEIIKEFSHVNYFKNPENIGFDKNADCSFQKALG